MAKTVGKYIRGEFTHKVDTPTQKFAAHVNGEYMETTAVKESVAFHALKSRYNKKHGRIKSAYVKVEWVTLKSNSKPQPAAEQTDEEPVSRFPLFDYLLE